MKSLATVLAIVAGIFLFNACEYVTIKPPVSTPIDTSLKISFKKSVAPLFDPRCTGCHPTLHQPDLRIGHSYASLKNGGYVNKPSSTSILMHQLNTGHNTATQISQAQRDTVAAWIDQGALDN